MSESASIPLPVTQQQIKEFERLYDLPGFGKLALESGVWNLKEQVS